MTDRLDVALHRLRRETGADAAVIASPSPGGDSGVVLATCPDALLPPGTSWPIPAHSPDDLGGSPPAPPLPATPTAVRSLDLDGGALTLTLLWCTAPPGELSAYARELIDGSISRWARALDENRLGRTESVRLVKLLDALDIGVASVDADLDVAHVNDTAAKLLGVPPGATTAAEFAAVLSGLSDRALNHPEAVADLAGVDTDPAAELKTTWSFAESPTHLGVVSKPAPYPWFDGRLWAFYDNSVLAAAMDTANRAHALVRASTDAMLDPQVLVEAVRADGRIVDLVYRDVNRATCEYLGLSRAELLGHGMLESLPNIGRSELFEWYRRCAETGEPVVLDGFPYHNELLGRMCYYDVRAAQAGPGLVSLSWRDVTERTELSQRIAASEEGYRLLTENVADVVVRLRKGSISWVSSSVEKALGARPEFWIGRAARDFVVPEERAAYDIGLREVVGGATYIGRARILGADGAPHWIHVHVKPFYRADGVADGLVASFRVIDQEVAAESRAAQLIGQRDEQNRTLTRRLQSQSGRLMAELNSAARYVASILPGELSGPVAVSSRYVPSRALGGDSYDYRWIDDDHLIVYLIDVSGHGVESSMVSVSVHNLLRSGSVPTETLLEPAAVLAELNRLFQMDQQGGNYFTAWYGVYQPSTRSLRYSCAGHPPALAFSAGAAGLTTTQLGATGVPVGTFEEIEYGTETFAVPPASVLLLYSDGAFEVPLPGGGLAMLPPFVELCTEVAGAPDWSLETLLTRLQERTESGLFEDDCTLVRVALP